MTEAPRVLITRSGPMPDSSARPQPPSSQSSWPGACASVSIAKTQPIPKARHSRSSVLRLLPGPRLRDHLGGHLADPGQLPQRPGPHPAGQLAPGQRDAPMLGISRTAQSQRPENERCG
jgi:hypothetical protein